MSQLSEIWDVKPQRSWFYCQKYKIRISECLINPSCKTCKQRLNGVEIMTERDEHGRFVKKPKQDEPKAEENVKVDNPETEVVTSGKKTITDHIREIAKEIGAFKPANMVDAFSKKGLSYKKSAIMAHIGALNVKASESVKKYQASIHKHAFLKKDADGKYTIV